MNNNDEKFGDAFKEGGPFADNIRISISGDDDELRESMKAHGWVKQFPALIDEHNVILVGHRRLKIAKELGIDPVIQKLVLGDDEESAAERLRIAIVSNVGHKPMTKEDRQRIAKYLYGEREWSEQRIANALGVSQKTISKDLDGVYTQGINPPRPQGGRPKGSATKPHVQQKESDGLLEVEARYVKGMSGAQIAAELGLTAAQVANRIKMVRTKLTAQAAMPEVNLDDLSMSMQQKCEAWKRQTEKRLRIEIADEERAKMRNWVNDDLLPMYQKRLDEAAVIKKAWKGVFTASTYRRLLAALHPDRNSSSDAHELFILFKAKESVLLSDMERMSVKNDPPPAMPKSYAEWMERRAKVSEERKAKRAANKAARGNS